DIHGNVTTCSFIVTITDDENPTITCPANITQTADAGLCSAAATINAPVVADNCAVASVTNDYNGTANATDVYPVGTTTIIWTVTDIHGNASTCSMTVTVTDDEQPIINCTNDISVNTDLGLCSAAITIPALNTTDNCAIASIINDFNGTADASGTYQVGTTTVTWTVTDIHGNTNTCTFDVVVTDNELPAATCSTPITVNNDLGLCSAQITVPNPIVSDNCGIASITNDYTNSSVATNANYPVGSTTITYTVTDINNNVTTCSTVVTVVDVEAPSIACSGDQTVINDAGICGAYVTILSPVIEDNCGIASLVNSFNNTDDASGTYPVGVTVITWTVTDVNNNINICTQTITVTDLEEPVITCPANITTDNTTGSCNALVTVPAIIATDNCGVVSISNDYTNTDNATDIYPVGTTNVVWTVVDAAGNTSTCTQIITVVDNELPNVQCPSNVSVSNDPGVCGATVAVDVPIATDNCGILSITNDYNNSGNASGYFPVGTTTIVWTITDVNNNTVNCTTQIVVTDTEQPVINCIGDITVNNDADQCGAIVNYDLPIASDNCAVQDVVLIAGNPSGDLFPVGTTIVTYAATDIHGNITNCSFNVIVIDAQEPVIDCPSNIQVTTDDGVCGAIVNYDIPNYIDNCSDVQVQLVAGPAPGSFFETGITEVTYAYTDASGNTGSCTFTIEVIDDEDPTIQCPGDMSQEDPIVIYDLPTYADNCGAEIALTTGLESGDVFPHGITTVTYVAFDAAGNSSECSFNVLINTPPVAVNDSTDFLEEDHTISIDVIENDSDPDGDDITLTSADAIFGDVTIDSNGTIFYHVDTRIWCGTDTITYVICDSYGACDTATVTVDVECFIDVIVPEGFSPNNDGVNDTFTIIGLEDYPGHKLTIFNRWGHKVFEATNYQNDWDGTSQAILTLGSEVLPKGTYYYVLLLEESADPVKGFFFLNH
ncbi:MAG: hypothetical protein RLZZ77_675, partial [Bacteroidota bacterium]